ncbi:hypothetical protein TIFTF001_028152 [Ficus carica]|uniref:Uncharacterized protein n=1 Tax=Ficus carica TaxID=3494 RepID=A0AA88J0T7_FICCA|nr:hypothetical protein TIFTF001_028152 [Ficus carica]
MLCFEFGGWARRSMKMWRKGGGRRDLSLTTAPGGLWLGSATATTDIRSVEVGSRRKGRREKGGEAGFQFSSLSLSLS